MLWGLKMNPDVKHNPYRARSVPDPLKVLSLPQSPPGPPNQRICCMLGSWGVVWGSEQTYHKDTFTIVGLPPIHRGSWDNVSGVDELPEKQKLKFRRAFEAALAGTAVWHL